MTAKTPLRADKRATPKAGFFGRLLDPIDLLAEVIFSVLMMLIAIPLGG